MNSNRLIFVDLARSLAAIFMVLVHVLGLLSTPQVEETVFGTIVTLLGSAPAAPVFMFAMGLSFALTDKRNAYATKAKRGIRLLAQGYLLNLMRLFFPLMLILLLQALAFSTPYGDDKGEYSTELIENLFVVDILQFAGIAYLFLVLLSFFKLNRIGTLCTLIVIVALCSPLLWGITTGNQYFDRVIDLLWGEKGELVSFPFFPWIVYPLFGMIYGVRYSKSTTSITRCLKQDLWVGVTLMIVGAIVTCINPEFHLGDYWRTGPGGIMLYLGFIPIWLFICHKMANRISVQIQMITLFTSRHITSFYFIQWIIISSLVGVLGENSCNLSITLLLMTSTLLFTYLLTYLYKEIKSKYGKKQLKL